MSKSRIGKLSASRMERLLAGALGAPSNRVLLGAGPGLDAAVLELSDGQVMAVAEDPIFPAPGLPLDIMGWFTVHIGASDVAVTGVRPEFMTYTLLMPPDSPDSDGEIIVRAISEAACDLGISILGGHTGWYNAVNIPTVGGVTVWGFAPRGKWISPGGACDGDIILMTKGPAIEAGALLAVLYRERLADRISSLILDKLCSRTKEITVVVDALTAFEAGGVHAMHDATECGVLGGLYEMSVSSGLRLDADFDAVSIPADIAHLADVLEFDPWQAISEGTLLAAVRPDSVERVMSAWNCAGIPSFQLGRFRSSSAPSTIRRGGRVYPLTEPESDPFWRLFFAGLSQE